METIECHFHVSKKWEMDRKGYICKVLINQPYTGTRIKIEEIDGDHMDGKSNGDVEVFAMENIPKVNLFPANIDKFFKNITTVAITGSELSKIEKTDLKTLIKLRHLYLSNNLIENIPGDLFNNNKQLEVVALDGNQINHISPKTFSGLNKLRSLNFQNNDCKTLDKAKTREEVLNLVKRLEQGECQSISSLFLKIDKVDEIVGKLNRMNN